MGHSFKLYSVCHIRESFSANFSGTDDMVYSSMNGVDMAWYCHDVLKYELC